MSFASPFFFFLLDDSWLVSVAAAVEFVVVLAGCVAELESPVALAAACAVAEVCDVAVAAGGAASVELEVAGAAGSEAAASEGLTAG
jgi:hypothetical protein